MITDRREPSQWNRLRRTTPAEMLLHLKIRSVTSRLGFFEESSLSPAGAHTHTHQERTDATMCYVQHSVQILACPSFLTPVKRRTQYWYHARKGAKGKPLYAATVPSCTVVPI